MKQILTIIVLSALLSCYWQTPLVFPVDPDAVEQPEPIVVDTCADYEPILLPEFIGAFMEMDAYQGDRVLNVGLYKDTIHEGGDIQASLDSMLHLLYPQYTINIYVNDQDDRLMSVILKGTNDKNKLLGKLMIRYNGYKHYFGCSPQSLLVAGSQTFDEFRENLIEFPSFRYVNHRNMMIDSVQHIKLDEIALDSTNCKGGRDWYDFYFRPYAPLPQFVNYAEAAGWPHINHTPLEGPGQTVELIGWRTGNALQILLDNGYSVKIKE